jgi:hypothetical protein
MSGFWIPHSAPLKDLVFLHGTPFSISAIIICFYERLHFDSDEEQLESVK